MSRALVVVVLGLLASACSEAPSPPTAPLAIATEEAAREKVAAFLEAYRQRDVEGAFALLCRKDHASRAFLERSLEPGSPFAVTGYELERPVPIWLGKEPSFAVAARFPRRSGEGFVMHRYRVRAREGCVDGFLPERAPPPESPRHSAPSEEGVIEL